MVGDQGGEGGVVLQETLKIIRIIIMVMSTMIMIMEMLQETLKIIRIIILLS